MIDTKPQQSLYPWLVKPYLSLADDLANDRLHHALLFHSSASLGKSQLLGRLVKLIHCASVSESKACGECQHCQLHAANTHADYYHIRCLDNKNQISIEQVRTLSQKLMGTGLVNKRRVVIIESVELMTESAQNALLKILEEPPLHVYFLLSTSNIAQVSATILSRCFKMLIEQPQRDKLLNWLERKSGKSITRDQLTLLGDSPLKAIDALMNDRLAQISPLLDQYNALYLAWQNRELDSAYSAAIMLAQEIEKLANEKSNPLIFGESLMMLIRFNHWVAKGQLVSNLDNSLLALPLQTSVNKIDALSLTEFDQKMNQLRHQLADNTGLNGLMQLRSIMIEITERIIED
ncbi:MAG: hypothetical protein BM565_02875 [Gammaproteobacteria bacterium MedPE]|nr:MAG: hypothetical protein BM565_02875 [Gammaproteobacteria bacterium MedPE]